MKLYNICVSGSELRVASPDPQRETLLRTIEGQALIGGRFEQLQRLGSAGGDGNFSLLITARDRQQGGRVALKFFHPDHLRNQYRWQCFLREPTLLQRFSREPDILQCLAPHDEFSVPFTNGSLTYNVAFAYYAVELAVRDVNEVILTNEWNPNQKLEAFRAMCRAIQRTHKRNIVHRDLKPSNFLLMPDGSLRLSDFGTARDLGDAGGALLARYDAPPGDRRYAAPEVLGALHDVDAKFAIRADIFSLGAILFELFTGTPLFFQVFDWPTVADLQRTMTAVDRDQRVRTYEAFLKNMADSHPLPSIADFGNVAPACIVALVDRLYRSMAAIDFRIRLCEFGEIFSRINTCLWVLRHEAAYQRLRERRQRAKIARQEKQRLLSQKATPKSERSPI
jgi:serine/threonine protein kinase